MSSWTVWLTMRQPRPLAQNLSSGTRWYKARAGESALLSIKAPGTGVCSAGPLCTKPRVTHWAVAAPATYRARIPPPTQSAHHTESTVTARRPKAVRKHGGDTNTWKGLTINTLWRSKVQVTVQGGTRVWLPESGNSQILGCTEITEGRGLTQMTGLLTRPF